MNEQEKFKRWVRQNSKMRGMLCHFYIEESAKQNKKSKVNPKQKQYYTKADYAFFNLFNNTRDWIVKGTTHHGITDKYGDPSETPCLNCFEVNKKFFKALQQLHNAGNDKFELGVIFNRNKLKRYLGYDKVIRVDDWKHNKPRPTQGECWQYDIPKKKWALYPFNYCNVVRAKIRKTNLRKLAFEPLPIRTVMGLLTRKQDYKVITMLPKVQENNIEVFKVL